MVDTNELLGQFSLDTEDLVEGQLDDIIATIVGFEFRTGGETIERPDGTTFDTRDQLVMNLRIESGADFETTQQFFNLPKAYEGPDGQTRRASFSKWSTYAFFLYALDGLGVSSNKAAATRFYAPNGPGDLVGMTFRRKLSHFPSFKQGETMQVHVPVEIIEFDNEIRAANGLEAVTLDEVPEAVTV